MKNKTVGSVVMMVEMVVKTKRKKIGYRYFSRPSFLEPHKQ